MCELRSVVFGVVVHAAELKYMESFAPESDAFLSVDNGSRAVEMNGERDDEGIAKTAKAMKEKGLDISLISEITGLTEEQITAL